MEGHPWLWREVPDRQGGERAAGVFFRKDAGDDPVPQEDEWEPAPGGEADQGRQGEGGDTDAAGGPGVPGADARRVRPVPQERLPVGQLSGQHRLHRQAGAGADDRREVQAQAGGEDRQGRVSGGGVPFRAGGRKAELHELPDGDGQVQRESERRVRARRICVCVGRQRSQHKTRHEEDREEEGGAEKWEG